MASPSEGPDSATRNRDYWDALCPAYQSQNRISTIDYHYGPLLAGDRELKFLPHDLQGLRCLEVGCGAGQNSIALARRGAACVAVDVSTRQLAHGRTLASEAGVAVDFREADMDQLPMNTLGRFHLIHSTYALPFSDHPARVIADCATMLEPGGTLLCTTAHPLFAGEWLEVDNGEIGLYLPHYFHLPADARTIAENEVQTHARYEPLGTVLHWFIDAGLHLDTVLEPAPLPVPDMSEEEIEQRIPYDNPDWRAHYEELAKVPMVVIIRCRKINQYSV